MRRQSLFTLGSAAMAAALLIPAVPAAAQQQGQEQQNQQQQDQQQQRQQQMRQQQGQQPQSAQEQADRMQRQAREEWVRSEQEDQSHEREQQMQGGQQGTAADIEAMAIGQVDPQVPGSFDHPPVNWVWVGYDTDNDGEIDMHEYVYSADLERARQTSQMRLGERPMQGQTRQQRIDQMQGLQARNLRRVQGTIQDTREITMAGMVDNHVLARIRTEDGRTARVNLGPKPRVDQLQLEQGDQVTVYGVRGTVNEQPMLIAQAVVSDEGQRLEMDHPRTPRLQRYTGELVSTQQVFVNQEDEAHVLAVIREPQGQTMQVDLGPAKDLEQVNLQQGERIVMLGRPAFIGGQPAIEAHQVRYGDRTIEISQPAVEPLEQLGQMPQVRQQGQQQFGQQPFHQQFGFDQPQQGPQFGQQPFDEQRRPQQGQQGQQQAQQQRRQQERQTAAIQPQQQQQRGQQQAQQRQQQAQQQQRQQQAQQGQEQQGQQQQGRQAQVDQQQIQQLQNVKPIEQMTPFEMMAFLFEGNQTAQQIEPKVRELAELYGAETNEQTFKRIGSALVATKQSLGAPEMEVLNCAIENHQPGADYIQMIAKCGVAISQGEEVQPEAQQQGQQGQQAQQQNRQAEQQARQLQQMKPIEEMTPFEMMAFLFEGDHTPQQIEPKVKQVAELYGEPATEESYKRIGSALVAAKQRIGAPEMQTLDCMIESHQPGLGYIQALAQCATEQLQ